MSANNLGEKWCCICNTEGVIDNFFICKGIMCTSVAHYSCAGIKSKSVTTFKSTIANCKGLSWSCPDCDLNLKDLLGKIAELTNKISNATPSPITAIEIPETSTERRVTRLQAKKLHLNIVPETTSERPATAPIANDNAVQICKTSNTDGLLIRSRQDDKMAVETPISKDTVINSHEHLMPSANATLNNSLNDPNSISVVKPRRWIFISRIHSSVTDEQFKCFIDCKFNLKTVNAIRMVPKVRNGGQYDYVSYRISVDEDAFATLINSKLWPPGIFIKEFEFTQKKTYFRFTGSTSQIT